MIGVLIRNRKRYGRKHSGDVILNFLQISDAFYKKKESHSKKPSAHIQELEKCYSMFSYGSIRLIDFFFR